MSAVATGLAIGALCLVGTPAGQADPLVSPTPAEFQYMEQARRAVVLTKDPFAFNSDAELLDLGRRACHQRDINGQIGIETTLIPPLITQLAFIYLCPR